VSRHYQLDDLQLKSTTQTPAGPVSEAAVLTRVLALTHTRVAFGYASLGQPGRDGFVLWHFGGLEVS
jgi:hypothetical protein